MSYDYYRRVLCPFCEDGEMRAVNTALARCSGCDETMSHGSYDALLQIRGLPEAEGKKSLPIRSQAPKPNATRTR
jgi:ribosomal protein L37AE/L43A